MRSLLACIALACCADVHACGESLPRGARTIDNAHYVVAFATTPAPIVESEHFVVDFEVCPREGKQPDEVRVDANMPEHRHGMNYRTVVTRTAPGRYRAEGLLFHMRGRWELTFDVMQGSSIERMAIPVVLE